MNNQSTSKVNPLRRQKRMKNPPPTEAKNANIDSIGNEK
jgi:hypothetical protein